MIRLLWHEWPVIVALISGMVVLWGIIRARIREEDLFAAKKAAILNRSPAEWAARFELPAHNHCECPACVAWRSNHSNLDRLR